MDEKASLEQVVELEQYLIDTLKCGLNSKWFWIPRTNEFGSQIKT